MPSVSVMICTHNPREDYMARTLEGLRRQTLPLDQWELLIIATPSNPPLGPRLDLAWHPGARVIVESQRGLTPARLRGFGEATGDLLVCVDDDNVLDPRYLEIARRIADESPEVGVFGGSLVPEFELEPSADVSRYVSYVALRTVPRLTRSKVKGSSESTPYGAGLCIRRSLALRYAEQMGSDPLRRSLDRSGGSVLICGEDVDMAYSVCDAGFEMMLTPELRLTHLIGRSRVEEDYVLGLVEGSAVSNIILAEIHDIPQWRPGRFVLLRGLARILIQTERIKRRFAIAMLKGRLKGIRILRQRAR